MLKIMYKVFLAGFHEFKYKIGSKICGSLARGKHRNVIRLNRKNSPLLARFGDDYTRTLTASWLKILAPE